jgi:hypothetical protein
VTRPRPDPWARALPRGSIRWYLAPNLPTVLICARPDLEADLCHTLFWRDDLERYVVERTDEARMLALTTEPHVVVVDLSLPEADRLIAALRNQTLPHPISIVALRHGLLEPLGPEIPSGDVDTVLSLPSGPEWDDRLVDVLQVPTRKQARFDVHLDVVTRLRPTPLSHHGLVLNMSSGGILIESKGLHLHPGDDVDLSLSLPGVSVPVEGRARVVRQPVEARLGLRFETFANNGDASVRNYLSRLAAPHPSAPS